MITKGDAGPRGWRIDDSGAGLAWKLDDNYRTGSAAVAPVICRGHAYVQYGASGGGGSQGLTKCRGILCAELATGRIVSDCRFANDRKLIPESLRGVVDVGRPLYSSMVAGDGILLIEGPAYGNGLVGFTTNPSDFRCIGAIDGATVEGKAGGFAFASCITPPLANGRLYVRGHPGMYCIDLRAAARSRSPQENRDEAGRAKP